MIEILKDEMCSGCNACIEICPKQCIHLITDQEGFWYPKVDLNLCIHCDLCNAVCPIETPVIKKHPVQGLACKNKNKSELKKSSSGGVFTLLAKEVIKNGGVVFGAEFNNNFAVSHRFCETEKELESLKGSKYVQSQIGNMLSKAKEFLDAGRKVLFSGTPCQIEGLLSYLKNDYENLITVDIVCHGVPSPKVWEFYLNEKNISNITNISHRSKAKGWQMFSMEIKGDTDYISNLEKDEYLRGFLKDLFLRPACYECAFKRVSRRSDITLADFWGIRSVNRAMDDDSGVSLVMIQSDKGKQHFDLISDEMEYQEVNLEEALCDNTAVFQSSHHNPNREKFFDLLNDQGVCKQIESFYPFDEKAYLKRQLRRKLSNLKNLLLK